MKFRKEMNGITLAMVAGVWASVAVGQGQGPGIEALLLPDSPASAPAAVTAPEPAAKPAEKVPAPVAAKPATSGKYKIVKAEKPVPAVQEVEKKEAKAPVAKPVEKAPAPVAAKPAPKAEETKPETKVVKEEKPVPPVQKAEKTAEKAKPTPAVAAKPAEGTNRFRHAEHSANEVGVVNMKIKHRTAGAVHAVKVLEPSRIGNNAGEVSAEALAEFARYLSLINVVERVKER